VIGYKLRECCAGCDESDFLNVLSLGEVPLAGVFPLKEELGIENTYPLNLLLCKKCKLVQTDSFIEPQILFEDYRYISSVGLSKHFENVAKSLDEKYDVSGLSMRRRLSILEIGCNDGVLLEPLFKLGANVEGVDPAKNIVKLAKDKGLKVYEEYFNDETFGGEEFENKYDLVLSNNTFAHIPDIQSVVRGIKHVLKPSGDFIFEVHYLQSLIDGKQWDNIYHEHIFYHSITGLNNLFNKYDMTLIDFEEIPIHSGSIRVTVTNSKRNHPPQKVLDRIELESKTIANVEYLRSYGEDVRNHITNFNNTIEELQKNYTIAGYGASGRANMFCNLTDLNSNIVKFIVDESPERCGRYIANTDIPIVDVETLKNSDVDLLIIFAWNYSKMIIEKTQFAHKGLPIKKFKYLVAFPTIQLVDTYDELKGFDSI
jgi:methylation protein EvaC